ncbi:MAG: lamin tail domain-containing protein [Lewinellaceae bacterium]|nr:lamin tail domain-containing protein [Lewinellaceae bacterium]
MKTIRLSIFVLVVLNACSAAYGQIIDDFSDGDFTQNPAWQGDLSSFKVSTAGELQLNAVGAGQSAIWVGGNMPDSLIWEFDVRLSFDPSGSNLLRIMLQTDQPDVAASNGYFLELGESGSADAIRFFRQDGTVRTQLAAGQPGLVASSPNLKIRVKRTASGEWAVDAAASGMALQPQFFVTDNTWPGGTDRFFGFQCVYTASNAAKFYFDNINIRPDVPDTQAPVLLSAVADNANTVTAVFDEELDSVSATLPAHYELSPGGGQPASVVLLTDRRSVRLNLQTPLVTGAYTLQTLAIQDDSGNESGLQTATFTFVKIDAAELFDIVINEIMADPSPRVGLPEMEWLELFNRSGKTLDLAALRLRDATGSPVVLPAYMMVPGEYLVVTATANADSMQAVSQGTVLGASISPLLLNNDGDILTLTDADGNVIDRVAYSSDWHTESGKDNGGWTLERVNPDLPCLGRTNWRSCGVLPGGTPGKQNSVYNTAPDLAAPHVLDAFPESATSVLLRFTEGLDGASASDAGAYLFSPPVGVVSAVQLPGEPSKLRLALGGPLQPQTLYAIEISTSVADCSGNAIPATDTAFVGLPEKPEPGDVVVNEMMFNPATGNQRYIEFFNRSSKVFNWAEFFLANFSDGADVEAFADNRLMLPGRYDVFTPGVQNITGQFNNIHPENVLENTFPSFDDNSGNVTLYWSESGQTVVVDSFDYAADLHNGLLSSSDRDGVALERIDVNAPTNLFSNWTSASPLATGLPGTPTLPNSQRRSTAGAGDELITLPLARLSPDDDGYEDFLEIRYTLPQAGFGATMTIFDAGGIPVRRLVRQDLIGTEGLLRWDGDFDDGTKAKPGIYVLFMELFGPSGETRRVKKAFAVVARF